MTRSIKLAVRVSPERQASWSGMAARSSAVAPAVDDSFDAVITDDIDFARDVMRNGRFVLIVEPFDPATDVRREFEQSGRVMPAHPARFAPGIRKIRHRLDEGQLGEPGLLRIHAWAEPEPAARHSLERELDLTLWLFGQTPKEVYAVEHAGHQQVHLGFPGNGMAMISFDANIAADSPYSSLSLIGSAGAAYADDHRNVQLLLGRHGMRALPAPAGSAAIVHLIDAFTAGVTSGVSFSPLWSETESAIRVADAVRSSLSGQNVVRTGDRHA